MLGSNSSIDSGAGIPGRVDLAPLSNQNPGPTALNPGGLEAAPPLQ